MYNFLMVCIIFYVFRLYLYKLFLRVIDMLLLKGYIFKSKNSKENLYIANCLVFIFCNNVLIVMIVFKY